MPSKPTRVTPRGVASEDSFKDEPLQQVRLMYLGFVAGLFSACPKGQYHWEEGDDTEIVVTDEHPIRTENVGARPAVSFTRSPVQFYSLGNDDMLRFDFTTGRKTKVAIIPGTMSINCCSRNDLESESIAWKIAEHLWLLRETLMGYDKFFEIGRQPQLSATSPAEGIVQGDHGEEWYCTTVSSPFQFPRMSQFTPLNKQVVQSIELQIRTRLLTIGSQSTGGPVASANGADPGLNFQVRPPPGYMQEASDAHGRRPDPAGLLPDPPFFAAHPLDPARTVVVRRSKPYRPGLRPLSMNGHRLPIADSSVEESVPSPPYKTRV